MKKLFFALTMIGGSTLCMPLISQAQIKDSLGLPGDNCNLYAVLNLFQQSKTLEEFESKLNSADARVNNLDLNEDHKIDYIKVVDNMQGSAHAIVLKDEINQNETQDIASIEVQKDNNGNISIQIIGDEELYGKNYIVEPNDETNNTSGTPNPGYSDSRRNSNVTPDNRNYNETNTTNNYYNDDRNYPSNNTVVHDAPYEAVPVMVHPVATWSIWQFLFAPSYVVYESPYRWGYYPSYWHPWEPLYYHQYYSYNYAYYDDYYYSRVYTYHDPYAHGYFRLNRSRSRFVERRRRSGGYNDTYARHDLLTQPALRGIRYSREHASEGHDARERGRDNNNVNHRNESRPSNENNGRREPVSGGNTINEHERNNNRTGSQPRNNVNERENQHRENDNNRTESQPRNNVNERENQHAERNTNRPESQPRNNVNERENQHAERNTNRPESQPRNNVNERENHNNVNRQVENHGNRPNREERRPTPTQKSNSSPRPETKEKRK